MTYLYCRLLISPVDVNSCMEIDETAVDACFKELLEEYHACFKELLDGSRSPGWIVSQ